MPIYEFICSDCGHQFEELQLEKNMQVCCPGCDSLDVRKLISSCRAKVSGNQDLSQVSSVSGGSCSGCSGGNCSSCG